MVRWNLFLVVLALVRAASIIVQNQNCTPDRMIIAPVGIHAGDALVRDIIIHSPSPLCYGNVILSWSHPSSSLCKSSKNLTLFRFR
mmetsp:Transcript_27351/g.63508  ORF Transcript_27351/g.63508 Transcript_27351/m.63508 type:complete len:86 (-) Transcript_27351:643-900(-)